MYYFILGILFINILLPIMEAISSCICTRIEQYKTKCAVKINKYNMQIEKDSTPITEHPIGFQCAQSKKEFDD